MPDENTQVGQTQPPRPVPPPIPVAAAGQQAANPVHPKAAGFDIPKFVTVKYPDLVGLILDTKSMDDKERQYWFHILPIMSEQQVTKLRGILTNEKQRLADIDKKYSDKINGKSTEKVDYWEEQKIQERFVDMKAREKTEEEDEKAAEAMLIKQLEDMENK